MNCPKCGAAIEEGKAYCANPACGAVPGAPAEHRKIIAVNKNLNFSVKLDFVLLARLAAALITVIAAALLYFSRTK